MKLFVVEKMDRRPTAEYNADLASTAFNYERDNLIEAVLDVPRPASEITGIFSAPDMYSRNPKGG